MRELVEEERGCHDGQYVVDVHAGDRGAAVARAIESDGARGEGRVEAGAR